ncbi:MAG TPA: hypothetical protein VF624_15825 [Tepidisphaeraceae bacterium]
MHKPCIRCVRRNETGFDRMCDDCRFETIFGCFIRRPHPGLELLEHERERQIMKGFDAAHDDGHIDGTLWKVACALLSHDAKDAFVEYSLTPPDCKWVDKLIAELADSRIAQLTVAGAFVVAEIERIQRLKSETKEVHSG